jgi:outer membrane protein W
MKTFVGILAFCGLAAARSLSAQAPPVDIEFFYVWAASPGGGHGPRLDFSGSGVGGGFNYRWEEKFSTEISAWSSSALLTLADDGPVTIGAMDIVPLTATVQWHPLGRKWFDPYVGIGGAVLFPSPAFVFGSGTGVLEVLGQARASFAVQAGFRVRVIGVIGLLVDARYLPGTIGATLVVSDPPGQIDLDVDADLIAVASGLSLRF